ncbi:MAG TPA: ABC transporter ATP-binding protein, partial [Polyangiales bacterium]|nr:ABC transporter ATP-binding protein [Polyangiales bacterium]
MTTSRLSLSGISKTYPGVVANDGISLEVAPGEIHAVLGENGAGKSTLMKIIFGAVRPDAGEVRWNGQPVTIENPQQARALGIAMVFQHFSLFDTLTAAENIWLGLDKSQSLASVTANMRKLASTYGLDIDPVRPVHTLSVGERQRVEILRALLTKPQLLILDEPTSVLTPQAVQKLFVMLRRLSSEGCAILYISHKLDEIRALCHRCTVLRGGRVTGEVRPAEETNASLSRLMIGAEPPRLTREPPKLGPVALQVTGLNLGKQDQFGVALRDVAFEVRAGEIVGIAGVSGNGQAELMASISGEDPRAPRNSLQLFGSDLANRSPRERRRAGLHFVPEERLGRGAVPTLSLAENTLLTRTGTVGVLGWLRLGQIRDLAKSLIARFKVSANGPQAAAKSLSGGNLQ